MSKTYVFDLDGTLLDSLSIWDHIGEQFLIEHHIDVPEHFNDLIKDMSFAQSAAYCIELGKLNMSVVEVCKLFYKMVEDNYRYKVPCKDHVKAFLDDAVAQGITMGIVTSLDAQLSKLALARLDLLSYFSCILTCDEVGAGKDEATIYLKACEQLHASISETLVFEDALYCMKTAKAAGFQVCGVYDKRQDIKKEDIDHYCDVYIHNFKELIK